MRKLKIIEHISLDGVIQNSADDGDFPYSDWSAPYRSPAGLAAILAAQGERFDLLLGRRTYDLWSGYWPKAPGSPMADRLNAAKKYVATHRPESLAWGPFEGFGPDIALGVRRIKSQYGPDIITWGSSTLTSTLLELGLADEVLLAVNPVLLGTGKRFLCRGNSGPRIASCQHASIPFRHHLQHLQGRRAFERNHAMNYIDIFVAAVPTANRAKYLEHASATTPIFKDCGALKVQECWGDDVPEGKLTSLPMAVKCQPEETVVFSSVTWPSRAVRDEGMKKFMADPRLEAIDMPFDGKRMIFGGFQTMVEA